MLLILSQICLITNGQIIADHRIVADFDKIPPYYISEVKKMFVSVPGESHSAAYRYGCELLEASYPAYQVNVLESGTPEAYTDQHLRLSRVTWGDYDNSSGWIYDYGEEDWFTNTTAIARTKAGITYCNTHSLTLAAIGFGWCTDMFYGTPSNTTDPVYGCHWSGASQQGPEGDRCWGLDDADYTITGNTVNLDTYLNVTQQYIDYCTTNSIPTKVFFTTGPVDGVVGGYTPEKGYVAYLKHERIRDYVKANPARILFDYADILCYDNDGTPTTTTWNGHTFPIITTTNLGDETEGHIGSAGCIRLAKAMWWMLARLAGWNGVDSSVPVTGITVTGAGGATTITTSNGTLQISAAVSPSNATNQTVTWTIANGTGQASVSASGLVTASANGTVTARATANDGSGVYGTLVITISNQVIPVTGIAVTGVGGATTITSNNGTLQLSAAIAPSNATNQTVTWTIANGTGQASISASGLVRAITNGIVTARATATDGTAVNGTIDITLHSIDSMVIVVSKDKLNVTLDESYSSCKLSLYNLLGHLINSQIVKSNLCVFEIAYLRPGVYLIVLSKNIILRVEKVIISY